MTETERLLPASATPRPTAIILAAPPTDCLSRRQLALTLDVVQAYIANQKGV